MYQFMNSRCSYSYIEKVAEEEYKINFCVHQNVLLIRLLM